MCACEVLTVCFLVDNNQAVPEAPAVPAPKPAAAAAGDPDEVDISEHFYSPAAARLAAQQQQAMPSPPAGGFPGLPADMTEEQQAQLRQMMLGGPPGAEGMAGAEEDPLMKMMAQMMSGTGGGGAGGGFPGMPGAGGPNASPFAGMMGAQQQPSSGPDVYGTIWRVVHALLALGLGLYIALMTPFNGTKTQRQLAFKMADDQVVAGADDAFYAKAAPAATDREMLGAGLDVAKKNFFWAFATAEAVLLTTKFFLDKGRAPPPGFVWSMAGQLPMPWRGYVTSVMRYGQIFTTVRTDILLCAFVLGVCAWWRGQL